MIILNMTKFDLKDRKILFELDTNSRQSFHEIAKKVGLSKDSVIYRINKLQFERKSGTLNIGIKLNPGFCKNDLTPMVSKSFSKVNRLCLLALSPADSQQRKIEPL